MNRRAFVTGLGAVLAAPRAAEVQAGKPLRIGVLSPAARESQAPPLAIFRQALRDLGNIEGQNVAFEIRYADGRLERLAGFADELVRLKVDVIVAPSDPSIAAAQKATTSIPIVMVTSTDPVGSGFVASLCAAGR